MMNKTYRFKYNKGDKYFCEVEIDYESGNATYSKIVSPPGVGKALVDHFLDEAFGSALEQIYLLEEESVYDYKEYKYSGS